MSDDDLEQRFADWVEHIVRERRFWIMVGENGNNTVIEDPEAERDLQLIYGSEDEARADDDDRPSTDGGGGPRNAESIETDDLPALCDKAIERGDAFGIVTRDGLIVAEPDVLRDELLKYATD
jgi:hypothetical protein